VFHKFCVLQDVSNNTVTTSHS